MKVTITGIRQETPDAKTFFLAFGEEVTYRAGQFITFLLPSKTTIKRRSYSFSSAPEAGEIPAITIKRTPNGEFSRWWMEQVKPGETLEALAPAGVFTIQWQTASRDLFFCAAGTGITPIFSLLKAAMLKETNSRFHLFYSNHSIHTALFYNELRNISDQNPGRLSITWLFSNDPDLTQARLSSYNLQLLLRKHLVHPPKDALMLVCGPYDYMKMVEVTWLTEGYSRENFRKEIFDPETGITPAKQYFDHEDRIVTIVVNGIEHELTVQWSESILNAGLRAGISLPFNCRAGRCSTCICRVKCGKTWMHYNEVLTAEDEKKGFVLACTAHPTTPGVRIEF